MIEVLPGERVCEAPVAYGERKGQPATGTEAGYSRHYRRGEKPCDECRAGYNAEQAAKRKPRKRKRPSGWRSLKNPPEPKMTGKAKPMRTEPLFRGSRFVVCACGARGTANQGLLKRGQRKIESCVECR